LKLEFNACSNKNMRILDVSSNYRLKPALYEKD
jgi:hypothetical protein